MDHVLQSFHSSVVRNVTDKSNVVPAYSVYACLYVCVYVSVYVLCAYDGTSGHAHLQISEA
jgi:hypothetical protein